MEVAGSALAPSTLFPARCQAIAISGVAPVPVHQAVTHHLDFRPPVTNYVLQVKPNHVNSLQE